MLSMLATRCILHAIEGRFLFLPLPVVLPLLLEHLARDHLFHSVAGVVVGGLVIWLGQFWQ